MSSLVLSFVCLHQTANVQTPPWPAPCTLAPPEVSCLDGVLPPSPEKQTFLLTVSPGLQTALLPETPASYRTPHESLQTSLGASGPGMSTVSNPKIPSCQHSLPRDSVGSAMLWMR